MKCNGCSSELDLSDHAPKICAIGHFCCNGCQQVHVDGCGNVVDSQLHRKKLYSAYGPNMKKLAEITITCENLEMKTTEDAKRIVELQQKFDHGKTKKLVECSECSSWNSETSVQICKSCVLDKHENFEDFAVSCATELPSAAICAVCAIRNHIKLDHDVLEYFPILSLNQYNTHVDNLEPKLEENQNMKDQIDVRMDTIDETFDIAEKELETMYDMMRRSKNSEIQDNLAANIGIQIEKFKQVLVNLEEVLTEANLGFKSSLNLLALENQYRSSEDFVDKIGDVYGKGVEKTVSNVGKKKKIVIISRVNMQSRRSCFKKYGRIKNIGVVESTSH